MEVVIKNLTKQYKGGKKALNGVSFSIESGMFGLLGPNGAGKSSLMRILVTLMEPTSGSIKVNGMELTNHRKEVRKMLGYLPQDFSFFTKLKTWEFLDFSAQLAGVKGKKTRRMAVEEMLEEVGLYEARNRLANKLSGGMKRRLGIAQALIGAPKIVIVDEPTTGLDPDERIRFRNLLSRMSQQDIIIILSTHIVGDISSTCRQMALLNQGEIVFTGSPSSLVEEAKDCVWSLKVPHERFDEAKERFNVIASIPEEGHWEIQAVAEDVTGFEAKPLVPNLEHAYVYYMEHKLAKNSQVS